MSAAATTPTASASTHPPAPHGVRRFLEHWHTTECYVAVAAFSLIAALLLGDVLLREFIGPLLHKLNIYQGRVGMFVGSFKISVFALIIGSFAGIGIATATSSHLVPRVGFGWVPSSWGPFMDRLADVITGLVLLAATYYSIKYVLSSRETGLRAAVIDWPIWPVQLALPLGFASAGLRYFFYAAWPSLRPIPPEFQE
jgi:Tripartite ATP-independent periplasmic transporters, DctQ component